MEEKDLENIIKNLGEFIKDSTRLSKECILIILSDESNHLDVMYGLYEIGYSSNYYTSKNNLHVKKYSEKQKLNADYQQYMLRIEKEKEYEGRKQYMPKEKARKNKPKNKSLSENDTKYSTGSLF